MKNIWGRIDWETHKVKSKLKKKKLRRKISFLRSFSIFVHILLGAVDLFESREQIKLIISHFSLGLTKKKSSDLFLRVAMDIKKLSIMFAISIGSVLVVSIGIRILGVFD